MAASGFPLCNEVCTKTAGGVRNHLSEGQKCTVVGVIHLDFGGFIKSS